MRDYFNQLRRIRREYPDMTDRAVGTSTAIALEAIAKAIRHPGKWVDVVDHHGTVKADEYTARMAMDAVVRLDLTGFSIGRYPARIKFSFPDDLR